MTAKTSNEKLTVFLDALAVHGTSIAASRVAGINRGTIWAIGNISEKGEDYQEIDWNGYIKPFHAHVLDALDMAIENVQQDMTHAAWQGRLVDEVHGGAYHFEDCEYAASLTAAEFKDHLAMDDEMRDLLGVPRVWEDKKRRVFNPESGLFERVRVKRFIPPTVDGQSKILSSFAPELFGDKRSVTLNGQVSLGVTVVGQQRPLPAHVLQQIAAPTPPLISADAEYEDVTDEPDAVVPEPEPVPSSLNAEQQRILQQLRSPDAGVRKLAEQAQAAVAHSAEPVAPSRPAPAPTVPGPSNYTSSDQDDCMPRRPVGMKVV